MKTGEQCLLDLNRPDKFVNVNGKIYYTFLQKGSTGISTLSDQVVLEPSKYSISSLSDAGDNRILFVAKVAGEMGSKIFLLDLKTKETKFLGMGKTASLDGNTLYFTDSFGEEVNNVYKKDLDSNKVTKVTNVLYGASAPVVVDAGTTKSDKDDKDSKEEKTNKKLVYLNYTTKGDSISTLDMKYAVNKTEDVSALESERKARQDKNFKLYGDYGKAYNPNVTTAVTENQLVNNDNKEVKGFFFPDFTRPSITLSTSGVGVRFRSANLNNTLTLSYNVSSFYTGKKGYITPGTGPNSPDIVSPESKALPLYWTIQKKDNKTDNFTLGFIHGFSYFSNAKFGYFHSENIKHGISYSNLNGKDSSGKSYRTHSDEMYLTIPFNIPTIDKGLYLSAYTSGDFQSEDTKGLGKIWDSKIELQLGYNSYSTFLVGSAQNEFGMVIKNKKTSTGSYGTNYFYADRNIKYDVPYLKTLGFLSLRGRLYFAPNTFSDSDTALTDLGANGLGFTSVGSNTDSIRTFITNARFAGKLYGDMKYNVPINKGTGFGMLYLTDAEFRLGYSYTAFMDEDYKGRSDQLATWASKFPEAYSMVGKSQKYKQEVLSKNVNELHDISPNLFNAVVNFAKNSNSLKGDNSDYTTIAKLMVGNMDKKIFGVKAADQPKIFKIAKKIMSVTDSEYMKANTPKKESKFRHGFTINPSVTLNGNIFVDSGILTVEAGNTYMAELTDDKLTDTDFWYISASLRF